MDALLLRVRLQSFIRSRYGPLGLARPQVPQHLRPWASSLNARELTYPKDPMTPSPTVILTTGGTIDKTYCDALSQHQVGEPTVTKLLATAHVTHPHPRKDSLDLDDTDRKTLRDHIAQLPDKRIIITHGTDTMTQTAKVLATIPGKTMVLTGALSPARFTDSDAAFNLGMAFATAQIAREGLYITMNGHVFPAGQVRKDRTNMRFVRMQD